MAKLFNKRLGYYEGDPLKGVVRPVFHEKSNKLSYWETSKMRAPEVQSIDPRDYPDHLEIREPHGKWW